MRTGNPHKVVMLPTHEVKVIRPITYRYGSMGLSENDIIHYKDQPQHLYILSNDKIKVGDWYINTAVTDDMKEGKRIFAEPLQKCEYEHESKACNDKNLKPCSKVISSTDKSITPNSWIPESFIKVYIRSFNQDKPITEVNLEIIYLVDLETNGIHPNTDAPIDMTQEIKTRPDGSIIIHPSKLYSRQEVEDLIYGAMKSRNYTPITEFREWINKNL